MFQMQIFVKSLLTDRLMTLEVDPSDTIQEVKIKLQEKKGISAKDQHLTFGGRPLKDDLTVSDYCIHRESTLVLQQRRPKHDHRSHGSGLRTDVSQSQQRKYRGEALETVQVNGR